MEPFNFLASIALERKGNSYDVYKKKYFSTSVLRSVGYKLLSPSQLRELMLRAREGSSLWYTLFKPLFKHLSVYSKLIQW